MKRFLWRNLKIGEKYSVNLAGVIVLFIIAASLSDYFLVTTKENINTMAEKGSQAIDISEIGSLYRSKDIHVADYINNPQDSTVQAFRADQRQINLLEKKIAPNMITAKQKSLYHKIVQNDSKIYNLFQNDLMPAILFNKNTEAASIRMEESKLRTETVQLLDQLRTTVNKERADSVAAAKNQIAKTSVVLLISIIAAILFSIGITLLINRMMKKTFEKMLIATEYIASGELNKVSLDENGGDELARLSRSLNRMNLNLIHMVEGITKASQTVNGYTMHLTESTKEIVSGNREIAATMNELSAGMDQQSGSAIKTANLTNQFKQTIMNESQEAAFIQKLSLSVMEATNLGQSYIDQSVKDMAIIYDTFSDSVEKVTALKKGVEEISQLTDLINGIAKQTNLLALNATIEAARAGTEGEGFAVVASEIRALAEGTAGSLKKISLIVNGIQTETENVSETLKNGHHHVEKGVDQIKETGNNFKIIKSSITEVDEKINGMSKHLFHINEEAKKINGFIETIAAVSEEANASVNFAAGSIDKIHATIDEVSVDSSKLSEVAKGLETMTKQFNI